METLSPEEPLYKVYIDWLVKPHSERELLKLPVDNDQFCLRYNTTKAALASVRDVPSFPEDIHRAAVEWAKLKLPQMFQSMFEKASIDRSGRSAKAFIDAINESEKLLKPDKNDPTIQVNLDVSDEQYKQILDRENKRLLIERGGQEESS